MANMTFSLDAPTKKRFVDFCDNVGLSASSVINVYIKTVVRENRIPFTISADPRPNAQATAELESDIAISRREFAEGKGIPLETVSRNALAALRMHTTERTAI